MELTIRPMTPQERMYSYSQSSQIEGQAGCIGHLRGDLDGDGEAFLSSWTGHRDDLKTQDFKDEFDDVINALRFDDQYGGILKSRRSLAKFCFSHPESNYGNDREFGFRADTPSYTFMLRLNPNKGEYNLNCYCFKRDWLDRHMTHAARGIRFITPDYKEKFRIEDGDSIRITRDNGTTADYVCRYIDEYHVEVGGAHGNLCHICEFAERMKMAGSTVIPIRASLPERCFSMLQSTGEVIAIERGKSGYLVTDNACAPTLARKTADLLNSKLGVSKAQEAAMSAGSMFGWDTPAADPKNYDAEGKAIKPKSKDRGDAR